MFVSVVICTHSLGNLTNLVEAIDSVLEQTHQRMEIIIVVDGNKDLYKSIEQAWNTQDKVKLITTEESLGAFGAGNVGVQTACGDIIAFMDDDAVADRKWLENLVNTYDNLAAISVGGRILPRWISVKPFYLPDEMYWLVGVTIEELAEENTIEVRNTYGPNMSFKREVFQRIGLFNAALGFAQKGTSYMQGGEAEFSLRMKKVFRKGVIYNPNAIVYHKIPASKVGLKILLKRAFYQGYSKAQLRSVAAGSMNVEKAYLKNLLFKHLPHRVKSLFAGIDFIAEATKILFLCVLVFTVGIGFIFGYLNRT
jgi:GT2 family glycosyltransferase